MKHGWYSSILFALTLLITGCGKTKGEFRVAATPVPHAEMLEFVKPVLEDQGIHLVIIKTKDYDKPDRLLADHKIEANFFQHVPFMQEQILKYHYPIESIAKIEIEPMGIYSKKYDSLSALPTGAKIAIPNNLVDGARALLLIENQGLIRLDPPDNIHSTQANIVENPKNLQFILVEPQIVSRSLDDVDAAAINTNFALQAGLSPKNNAIALESADSPYANVIAIRIGDENRPEIIALVNAMTSDSMRQFILDKYKGDVLPAF